MPGYGSMGQGWAKGTVRWLESADDATDPAQFLAWLWFDDFVPRKLRPPLLLAWLLLQGLGMAFQLQLLFKVSTALDEYEATLGAFCALPTNGICLASQWRLAADQVLEPGGDFSFTTLSEPSFLLGVEPSPSASPWELRTIGDECIMEATRPLLQQMKRDVQRWEGVIRSACEETVATGRGRRYTVLRGVGAFAYGAPKEWRLRLLGASARVFVVDPQSPRLADDAKAQCSFVQALQNFSERESGRHHGVLRAVRISIVGLLLVALIFAGLVFSRFFFYVAGDKLLRWW
ncbi:unnamed protein product [Effrenium voratum]|uniref:Uncharacterized protein n=1 Tax=Effrenium voratum TaxID=2562239 RepID=A0AA36N5H7_9DINO|nr:unnamed protein product [Effrenium voratum]